MWRYSIQILFPLLTIWHPTECARILLGVMPQGKSHTGSIMPLINRIKKDGHEVDLYMESYPDESDFGLKKRFIHIKDHPFPFASETYESHQWNEDFTLTSQLYPFIYGSESCDIVLREHRKEFDALVNTPYDLILTDSLFAVCPYAIASLNKGKHVIMYSTNVETSTGTMRAFGSSHILTPRSFMPLQDPVFDPSQFYYRLTGAYDWIGSLIQNCYIVGFRMWWTLREIVPDFSYARYISSASFAFTDMPPDIFVPFPRTNDLIEYGSYCNPPKALPKEFEDFVSDPTSKGTILIGFGTVINWKAAPQWKFKAIVEALSSLTEYRIIWSYNGNPIEVPPHIKLSHWMPQNDILHHNNTVLFFSHGGLKSVKEATCSSTPSLFMPMFAEQVRNSFLAKYHGYAEILNKHEITVEGLRGEILKILNNKSYQSAATKVKTLYNDKVIPSLDVGAHSINKLLKNGGRMPEFFYPRAIDFGFIEYLNVDILLFIPLILTALLRK